MPVLRMFKRSDDYYIFCHHYLPEEAAKGADKTHYQGWHRDGWLTLTPGNITDFDYIEDDLIASKGEHEVIEVLYDPFHMTQMATHLQGEGFPMVEYGMTVKNFSEPMKSVEAAVLTKHLHHNGDPVLRWMMSNVVARTDAKDNIFPRKEFPQNKIDGAVALIMAMARAQNSPDTRSVYEREDRGLITI
jgi:phage terminase large subunit-like protein